MTIYRRRIGRTRMVWTTDATFRVTRGRLQFTISPPRVFCLLVGGAIEYLALFT